MSDVTNFFFRSPTTAPSVWSIVQWWESRRLVYNAVVGSVGLGSLATIWLFANLPPHSPNFQLPWEGVIVYGVLANVCYSAGPVVDLAICRGWGPGFAAVGPALFRYGFAFAVGLTLLPVPLSLLEWGARLVWFFH